MASVLVDDLERSFHETNTFLRSWLEQAADSQPMPPRPASPQEIATLLSELMRAGGRLRRLPAVKSAELQKELDEYRGNVERLRERLPSIQSVLLKEQARLERERRRLQSFAEWADGSRQTL